MRCCEHCSGAAQRERWRGGRSGTQMWSMLTSLELMTPTGLEESSLSSRRPTLNEDDLDKLLASDEPTSSYISVEECVELDRGEIDRLVRERVAVMYPSRDKVAFGKDVVGIEAGMHALCECETTGRSCLGLEALGVKQERLAE